MFGDCCNPRAERLPEVVRHGSESVFGTDLSDVRIHEGPEAILLGARAFTSGSNVYFAPGQYDVSSAAGLRLLGHELTHVVQQRDRRLLPAASPGSIAVLQHPELEAEADRMGDKVAESLQRHKGFGKTRWRFGSGLFEWLHCLEHGLGSRIAMTDVVQLKPIDLKHLQRFLKLNIDKRYTKLLTQSSAHLARISKLLHEMQQTDAVTETLQDIAAIAEGQQLSEINRLGESANWANISFFVDGRLEVTVKAATSGLYPGRRKTKYGHVSDGHRKRCEIEMSCGDSEATGLNLLDKKVKASCLRRATDAIELVIVSTNGACDGCKGRINNFIKNKVLPDTPNLVTVSMTYKYSKRPRPRNRWGVNTYYGWQGDQQVDQHYVHTIRYR